VRKEHQINVQNDSRKQTLNDRTLKTETLMADPDD